MNSRPTQIVVHRWAGLGVLTAFALAERTPAAVVRTDPPGGARRHRQTSLTGLIDQEAIAELRIISVSIEQGVGAVGLNEFGIGDRLGQSAVIRLAGELEDPAGHRDRNSVVGELFYERVRPFPADWPATDTPRPGAALRFPARAA